jgi:hypothetical protein
MNPFRNLFRRLAEPARPERAAPPARAPRHLHAGDATLLRLVSLPGGRDMEIYRGGARVALVRPPAGAMVLEVLPLRGDDGSELLLGALYDLEERRGLVVRWESRDGEEPVEASPLFTGPPESVLWRLTERDGAVYARDTRHHVVYRLAVDAGVVEVVEGEEPCPAAARAAG